MTPKIWTIKELLDWSTNYFSERNIESARLDAELLLSWLLKLKRLDLYLQFDRPLSEKELQDFKSLIKRRIQLEPIAYITGEKEFYSRNFKVNSSVLIPRPDTETLIDITKSKFNSEDEIEILDIGTGSGILAITLGLEFPNSKITAIDISNEALKTAQENAINHQVNDRISFEEKDFLQEYKSLSKFDLIISNPPYISSSEIDKLDANVKDYEPLQALDGGKDGLDFYQIFKDYNDHLKENGWLIFEIGFDQTEDMKKLFSSDHWQNLNFHKDLSGINRVISVQTNK